MNYPDDSIQDLLGDTWWEPSTEQRLTRGALLWAFAPYFHQPAQELIPSGRADPRDHARAEFSLDNFHISKQRTQPSLPVAALPQFPNERRLVYRAKRRPVVVASALARYPSKTSGSAGWIVAPSVLVAPCFGVDQSGNRGGWPPALVDSIRRCQLPQYMWDKLPIPNGTDESIVRFDQIHPLRYNTDSFVFAGYHLSEAALGILDDWVLWYRTGTLDEEGALLLAHNELGKLT
jgi:hypothetical protein